MTAVLGAIDFNIAIRGILVVVVGTAVLGGSIYAIVASNTGLRAGFLIVMAGLFAWMFLMGSIWWIYGIGLKGRDAAWMPQELNWSREYPVATDEVKLLPPTEKLPDAAALMDEYPLIMAVSKAGEGADWKADTLTNVVTAATQQATITKLDVANAIRPGIKKNAGEFLADHPEVAKILSGSDEQVAEEVNKEAIKLRDFVQGKMNGWCLISETDSRRGEAVASSDAALTHEKAFGDPTSPANYITKDVFFYGGKEPCNPMAERPLLNRVWHRIATTFELKNPKLYSVVTLQKVKFQPTEAGKPPPTPVVEDGTSTVSVVMLRNLGNRRLIPAVFTIINFILFAIFASQLHVRDKRAAAARAAFDAKK